MKLRNGMLDETPENPMAPGQFGFYVAEAKKVADDVYRYEPFADYLVDVQMKGWYLPNSRRYDRFDVTGNGSGSQKILGFRPERFSLGIKRHRDTLEMVISTRIHAKTVKLEDCASFVSYSCDKFDTVPKDSFVVFHKTFTRESLSWENTFNVGFHERGLYDLDSASLDVVACSKKMWKSIGGLQGNVNSALFEHASKECEWRLSDVYGNHKYLQDPGKCTGFFDNFDTIPFVIREYKSQNLDVGCAVHTDEKKYLDSVCEYPLKTDDASKYNPNKKLFDVELTPSNTGKFFYLCVQPNPNNSSDYYWTRAFFNLRMSIPDSYWNAPFGMDNLVNRTIRFDHTNQTIFNDVGKDGYWNAVEENFQNSDSIAGYFDGNKWSLMPNYGLLTPYEVQHLIFFPVDVYSEGSNVFRFDDEGVSGDTVFKYSSSFELKFYGHDTTTHHFEAKIIGDRANPLDTSGCIMDASKFVMQTGASHPCQIRVTSEGPGIVKTPVFTHGNVHFFVGMNRLWSETDTENGMSIPYPADSATWRKSIGNICSDSASYTYFKKMAQGDKDSVCYKYYGSGSRVHYYFNDYSDSLWKSHFLTDSLHYFRNYVNSPGKYFTPKSLDDTLANAKKVRNGKDFTLSYFLNPDDYIEGNSETEPGRFFIRLDSLKKIKEEYKDAGITLSSVIVSMKEIRNRFATFDSLDMNLYIKAVPWMEPFPPFGTSATCRLRKKCRILSGHSAQCALLPRAENKSPLC